MRLTTNGVWTVRLALTPGCYRYLFVVDGNLVLDSDASATTGKEQISVITIK
jgi:hypothetical protein